MEEHRNLLDSTREGKAEREGEKEEDESREREKAKERKRKRRRGGGEEEGRRRGETPPPRPLPAEPEIRHKPNSWRSDKNVDTRGRLPGGVTLPSSRRDTVHRSGDPYEQTLTTRPWTQPDDSTMAWNLAGTLRPNQLSLNPK